MTEPPARPYALIDFEASCLPEYGQSFPIEVALARVDGGSVQWLIRPAPQWRYWDWSDEAQALHGLTRAQIEREGTPAAQVMAELNAAAAGYHIFADADLDAFWLETLAEACGIQPTFPVRYLGELMVEQGFTRPQVVSALAKARERMPREHAARADAQRLALTLKLLLDEKDALGA